MIAKLNNLRNKYVDLRLSDAIGYDKFTMIAFVYHSCKIEGCSLDDTEAITLLEYGLTAERKSFTDHLINGCLNH